MSGNLSTTEQQCFHDNGFVFPVNIMSAAEASDHVHRLDAIESQHGSMHYRVKPYLLCRSAYEISTSDTLLDAVESVIGPDILLWDSGYIIKEPNSRGFVSWHQDLTYWGLEMESDDDLLTAWVALTPATVANGCMQFIAASHRDGKHEHLDSDDKNNILHRGQTIAADLSTRDVTQITLAAGEASLHHGWAVHSSNQNTTNNPRIALNLNYAKPSVRQAVGEDESATLVRGKDRFQNFVPEPPCTVDFAPHNVRFQREIEKKKRAVYDAAG